MDYNIRIKSYPRRYSTDINRSPKFIFRVLLLLLLEYFLIGDSGTRYTLYRRMHVFSRDRGDDADFSASTHACFNPLSLSRARTTPRAAGELREILDSKYVKKRCDEDVSEM